MDKLTDWQLNPIHSGAFLRLQQLLPRLRGFRVLILQQNNPLYRDGLIEALRSAETEPMRVLDAKEAGSYTALETQLLDTSQRYAVTHIIHLESLAPDEQDRAFKGLNYHREQLADTCKHTLLFWLPKPLVKRLAKDAADFWAWREQVFDFSLPVEIQPRWEADHTNTSSLDKDKKQKRIQQINEYLATQDSTTPTLTIADMLHELGNLYQEIGEYTLAQERLTAALAAFSELEERHAYARVLMDIGYLDFRQGKPTEALDTLQNKVLPWFVQLNDTKQQVETQGRIADILQARGQLDEALTIRQKKELPVYEKLGDARSKAITMGKIADILQARGQTDEALATLRDTALPTFEKLGDVRSKAVTMNYIAGILQVRGQLDEALTTLRDEVLPAFEQLGDVHSKAATMGQIADILQARGQLDEALNIRQKEELPVYDKLGDVREKAITMSEIAIVLWAQDSKRNKERVQQLLCQAQRDFREMQLPEAETVQHYLDIYGLSCED